jgi:hypothetical protein
VNNAKTAYNQVNQEGFWRVEVSVAPSSLAIFNLLTMLQFAKK